MGGGSEMRVTVVMPDGHVVDYGYSPEHYAGVNLFYAQSLAAGEIVDYTIERGE
jgi:hypothetical protein